MPTAPTLLTPRLRLRPHGEADFTDCVALWAAPEVVRHISGTPSTPSETWSRLLRYVGHWSLLGYGYWVVETRETGQFLGEVGFADFHREIEPSFDGTPEAGWVFNPSAQGQGYGREAVTAAIDWADTHLDHDRTVCIIDPQNHPSIRLAQTLGYAEDGSAVLAGSSVTVYARPRQMG